MTFNQANCHQGQSKIHKCKEPVYSEYSRWSQVLPHARSLPTQHPAVEILDRWLMVVLHLAGSAALCTIPMSCICQCKYSRTKNSAENWLQNCYGLSIFILLTMQIFQFSKPRTELLNWKSPEFFLQWKK